MSASRVVTRSSPLTSDAGFCAPVAASRSVITASGGGDLVVAVQVAFLRCVTRPRLHEQEVVHAATAARDQGRVFVDAVSVRVGAGVVGVVVAFGAGVHIVSPVLHILHHIPYRKQIES